MRETRVNRFGSVWTRLELNLKGEIEWLEASYKLSYKYNKQTRFWSMCAQENMKNEFLVRAFGPYTAFFRFRQDSNQI